MSQEDRGKIQQQWRENYTGTRRPFNHEPGCIATGARHRIITVGDQPLTHDDQEVPVPDESDPLHSEMRSFSPAQMVTCEACLRANPPTRTSCLYCAAALPITQDSADRQRPTLRRLEQWEPGYNVILVPNQTTGMMAAPLGEMAELLRLDIEDLQRIVGAGEPLPLARVATFDEASLVKRRLDALNVDARVVADRDLAIDTSPPKRIRALAFTDSSLVVRPAGSAEELRVAWADVSLLVIGRLFVRRVEVEERQGRGRKSGIVNARELSEDEALLDIYVDRRQGGWRITAHNFDFSCLGEKKGPLVAENFSTLIQVLRLRAARAEYDDSYHRVRYALAPVWPLDQHTESQGWRRGGPGRYTTGSVTASDNETQFTRYSRLRHYLKLSHPEPKDSTAK